MHVLLLRYLDDVILMKRSTRVYSPWFSGVRLLNHKFLSALRSLPLYQYFVFLLFSFDYCIVCFLIDGFQLPSDIFHFFLIYGSMY